MYVHMLCLRFYAIQVLSTIDVLFFLCLCLGKHNAKRVLKKKHPLTHPPTGKARSAKHIKVSPAPRFMDGLFSDQSGHRLKYRYIYIYIKFQAIQVLSKIDFLLFHAIQVLSKIDFLLFHAIQVLSKIDFLVFVCLCLGKHNAKLI